MKSDSLGQLILTGVPGIELDSETALLFRRVQPGAFILFGRNIQSARQLRKLIDDLRDLSEVEPIITIDQEGGRVSRLRLIGNEPPSRLSNNRTPVESRPRPVDSMMICHGWYPCFNPLRKPASLSREVVTQLLRDELHFEGLIMTDDLDMGAILNEYGLEETTRL